MTVRLDFYFSIPVKRGQFQGLRPDVRGRSFDARSSRPEAWVLDSGQSAIRRLPDRSPRSEGAIPAPGGVGPGQFGRGDPGSRSPAVARGSVAIVLFRNREVFR